MYAYCSFFFHFLSSFSVSSLIAFFTVLRFFFRFCSFHELFFQSFARFKRAFFFFLILNAVLDAKSTQTFIKYRKRKWEKCFCFNFFFQFRSIKCRREAFFSPSQKPHPLPQARLSLTLIHRQRITMNDRAGVTLDRLIEWLKFCGVLDECDKVDDVLIFV